MRAGVAVTCAIWLLGLCEAGSVVQAHSGPPFPLVSERTIGRYVVGVWADPDTTNDGSAAGQFWVMLRPVDPSTKLASDTRAELTVAPADRAGESRTRGAEPVNGDVARQFAAVVLDHEGPFSVHVSIDGNLGPAQVDAEFDATYDLRPPRAMLILYAMPFVLVGLLWGKLLLRRRESRGRK